MMKKNKSWDNIFLYIIFVVIILSIILSFTANTVVEATAEPSSKGLTTHEPIYITGNSDFTSENGVTSGSGTEANATYNWWGSGGTGANTGKPSEGGNNPVSSNVIYNPWLTQPIGLYYYLAVNVTLSSYSVNSGEKVTVWVYVTNVSSGLPVEAAYVSLSSNLGGFFSYGYTDSTGCLVSTFTAPNVTEDTIVRIIASADKTGYVSGSGYADITVQPRLTSSAPIYINGNSNFTSANGVTSGSGTAADPYIIENYDIDASSANGIHVEKTSAYFIIRNCMIHDGKSNSKRGIYFYNVTYSRIDNVTSYNNYDGICLDSSSNNNITNCYVYNNSNYGIFFYNVTKSKIENVTSHNNDYGIYLVSSSNNRITNCSFYNNSHHGIWLHIYLYNPSNNNQILNCDIHNNDYGILLYSSLNNNITNCDVYNNFYGIFLYDSSNNNNITNSNVYNNYRDGVHIDSSSNNYIKHCNVYKNSWRGIHLYSSSNNQITNCNVYNNSWEGIWLRSSSNTQAHYCNIYDNTDYGIYNYDSEVIYQANATYNWWGSANGPGQDGANPVSSNVIYSPWLTEPWTGGVVNIQPTAYIDSITPNPATQGQVVSFVGQGTDTDGIIIAYNWRSSIDGQLSTQASFSTSTLSVGTHTIYFKVQDNNESWSSEDTETLIINPTGLTQHAPISISDNSQFNSTNGVTSGSGTQADPYIIENWDINANSAHGIYIENTNVYFIIRNCVVHDGYNTDYSDSYHGIYFYNVTNSKIDNVTSYNNCEGIELSHSPNNIIANCDIYNNYYYSIQLSYSSNNQITNCDVYNNYYYDSIRLDYSSSNNITNCNVYNNCYGIELYFSSNNQITNCNAYNNNFSIELCYSSNNTISNCAVYNNKYGAIRLYYSSNNEIHCCNIYDNTEYDENTDHAVRNYNTEMEYQVNAIYNWWGSANGPGQDGANTASTNVLYDPWLTASFTGGNLLPLAKFTYSPMNPRRNDLVQFTDLSFDIDGYIVSWLWDFGDGNTSNLHNPTHQYIIAGNYSVSLTVTDDDNASTYFQTTVNVLNSQPTLSGIIVTPETGTEDDDFTFRVVYADPDGDIPLYVNVVIDGTTHNMTYISGDYVTGAIYEYRTKLSRGEHKYRFECDDNSGALSSNATTQAKVLTVGLSPFWLYTAGVVGIILLWLIFLSFYSKWNKKHKAEIQKRLDEREKALRKISTLRAVVIEAKKRGINVADAEKELVAAEKELRSKGKGG